MTQTAPFPTATPPGGKPSAIVAVMRCRRGSMRQSRRSAASPITQTAPSPWAIPASDSRWFAALAGSANGITTFALNCGFVSPVLSFWTLGQPATQTPYEPLARLQAIISFPPARSPVTASNFETFPVNWPGPVAAT